MLSGLPFGDQRDYSRTYGCPNGAGVHPRPGRPRPQPENISVEIPHNAITVVTGVSGSGKSSLAFDTIYAEGQRRYVESLSAYARQFLERMEKPDVDEISGIAPGRGHPAEEFHA